MVGTFRTSSQADSVSSNPERTALRKQGEDPCYMEVLRQRADSLNIKRSLIMKENQISRVKEFSAFLCMGRCKRLGSRKSVLSFAQRSGAGILFSPPYLPHGSPWGVAAVWRCLWQGFSPSWLPSGLTSSPSVVALIADDSGILCLLIQQEICHFSKPVLLLWTCSCGWKSNFNHALVVLFCSNGIPGLSAHLDIKISCSLRKISTTFFNDEHILLIYIQLLAISASESAENFLNLLP